MAKVRIPLPLPSKANTYQIHFNKTFFQAIFSIVQSFKAKLPIKLYWIGPSLATKRAEEFIAMAFRNSERREWLNGEPLEIKITLIKQRGDTDREKCILDAIQKSGRIKNDSQFKRIIIENIDGSESAIEIEVEPIGK